MTSSQKVTAPGALTLFKTKLKGLTLENSSINHRRSYNNFTLKDSIDDLNIEPKHRRFP